MKIPNPKIDYHQKFDEFMERSNYLFHILVNFQMDRVDDFQILVKKRIHRTANYPCLTENKIRNAPSHPIPAEDS